MAETVTMPKLGFDMQEGTLIRWVIQEGETTQKGAILAEIETDKATVEVESPFEGILARQMVPAGSIVPVNTPIAVITAAGEKYEAASAPPESQPAASGKAPANEPASAPSQPGANPAALPSPSAEVKASPLARRMARELTLDLHQVKGSGPGGRITKRDIEAASRAQPAAAAVPAVAPPLAGPASATAAPAPTAAHVPLTRLRAAIARRMVEAKTTAPHFYVTHEYDMAAVMSLRKQINALLPEAEKISVNDFIIKAVALGLQAFPNLNASFQGDQVARHGAINIGVAVALETGLMTVVCRNADQKPLRQIAGEVKTLVSRAREGKVRPDDIEGSTFSISNLGMFEVENFIAIINPPEAAILAVGSVRETPVVSQGQIVAGQRMKATLSVDHRVSDGVEAARFLQSLATALGDPLRLLL